jgi:hypothetical protein
MKKLADAVADIRTSHGVYRFEANKPRNNVNEKSVFTSLS